MIVVVVEELPIDEEQTVNGEEVIVEFAGISPGGGGGGEVVSKISSLMQKFSGGVHQNWKWRYLKLAKQLRLLNLVAEGDQRQQTELGGQWTDY